ncbi:hypothetical protein Pmani_016140 [Petrolisthes manimaculis]|uniref:DDE-1 domain-containing protein n=1 Tax=Petrolisthes manimaculis TaxID=1843537 RepID=A0AAE1UBB2_9EUCA|nr:hypothetical protein Pmani_016140 [Petrolisthes manimaculis]
MPRNYVRKSEKQLDRTNLEAAFKHRVQTNCSMKEAAVKFGVKKTTLVGAFNRSKKFSDGSTYVPVPGHTNRVFTPKQETHIVDYTIHAAKMFYGLPMNEVRRMVYQYARACNSQTIPEAWEKDQMATRDWYYAFMNRHPNLVLKAPEGMSIARIVAFNKVNVETFFKAYTLALNKYVFTPDRIYNLDESSLSTVMKPCKVVCVRGKPVATQVTRERGDSMTFVGIINAVGQSIPPVFIIPRSQWNPSFMRNTIFGSKGILHPSGWMNGECFVQTLQHLHEKSGSSVENKILLIMDNAECHMNVHVVEFAIKHGIVIVTLPPHTTDKLQPLDVSVFGTFKTFLRSQLNNFALMHPNEHITVHQLPEFASEAWTKASTPSNILNGFRATGIWPLNELIFPEEAFVGAQVTERPAPPQEFVVEVTRTPSDGSNSSDGEEQTASSHGSQVVDLPEDDPDDPTSTAATSRPSSTVAPTPGPSTTVAPTPGPSTTVAPTPGPSTTVAPTPGPSPSKFICHSFYRGPTQPSPPAPITTMLATPSPSTSQSSPITPESIRPFPKAAPRPYGKGRKRVRACILTENEEAISDLRVKAEKKQKLEEKKKAAEAKKKVPRKKKALPTPQDDSSDEEDIRVVLDDSSEYSDDEEELTESTYPFVDKAPEEDNTCDKTTASQGQGKEYGMPCMDIVKMEIEEHEEAEERIGVRGKNRDPVKDRAEVYPFTTTTTGAGAAGTNTLRPKKQRKKPLNNKQDQQQQQPLLSSVAELCNRLLATEKGDEFHQFGLNVAAQLRAMPLRASLKAQLKIQETLTAKRFQSMKRYQYKERVVQ